MTDAIEEASRRQRRICVQNEKIAKWLGIVIKPDRTHTPNGDYYYSNAGTTIFVRADFDDSAFSYEWNPARDISRWHGPNGLLAEIDRRGIAGDFYRELERRIGEQRQIKPISMPAQTALAWYIRRAEAPQLSAALVKAILDVAEEYPETPEVASRHRLKEELLAATEAIRKFGEEISKHVCSYCGWLHEDGDCAYEQVGPDHPREHPKKEAP